MAVTEASKNEYLPAAELAERLRNLTEADLIRIKRSSEYLALGHSRPAQDLRNEAFRRAIAGSRKCRRDLPIVVFMYGVMRSIAFADRKALTRNPSLAVVPNEGYGSSGALPVVDPRLSPEDAIVEQDRLEEIKQKTLALFSDDLVAQTMVEGIMDEMEGEVLRALVGLEKKAFASKRRLVRRRTEKAFPGGRIPS